RPSAARGGSARSRRPSAPRRAPSPAAARRPCRRRRPSGLRRSRPRGRARSSGGSYGVEVGQLRVDPLADVMTPDVDADRLGPAAPLLRLERQRLVERVRLAGDVGRVDAERPRGELLVDAGVPGEDEDAVPLVEEESLLRDEIQAVEDRVDEQHVELLVAGEGAREVVRDVELDGCPVVAAEALVHRGRRTLDGGCVLRVLGDVLARGGEHRDEADLAVQLGMPLEEQPERLEAAHDVLRGVAPVDAEDELLGPAGDERGLPLEHRRVVPQALELVRVDADRTGDDARGAMRGDEAVGALEERAAPALGVEADDVVGEQPRVDRRGEIGRERIPGVRLLPRDVDEVGAQDVGALLPDERRREIEVVVVEEDRRLGLAVELLERRGGERLVHRHVAGVQGPPELRAELRRHAGIPEAVLQEPERRIGDDVVKQVICRGIVGDKVQPVRVPVPRRLLERAATLRRDGAVPVAHRARDPRHVVVRDEAGQRSDEASAAPPRLPALVRDRRPVGDDEQLAARRCPGRQLGYGRCRRFAKRSREPRAPGRDWISNSSAIVRMIAIPRPPSLSSSPSSAGGRSGSKPAPSSTTSIASVVVPTSYEIETKPLPSWYAWRTEFETASVRASLRSARSSSEREAMSARPLSASRARAMYSARAGMRRRIVRTPSSSSPAASTTAASLMLASPISVGSEF